MCREWGEIDVDEVIDKSPSNEGWKSDLMDCLTCDIMKVCLSEICLSVLVQKGRATPVRKVVWLGKRVSYINPVKT